MARRAHCGHRRGLDAPENLRAEYQTDPIGLGETQPRLSWWVTDFRRGARQTAYRVLVASDRELLGRDQGDLWDSGQVASGDTAQVVYAGMPLKARQRCWWKVRTWDAHGEPSPWSDMARFELGLLSVTDWGERTEGPVPIASPVCGDVATSPPAPFMRRSFEVIGRVERARLYITALGLYEAYLNGQRVTDDVYRPGWTDYSRRVPYQTYDVTDLLHEGENVLGAILGDGWYCGFIASRRQLWGDRPQLMARLEITLADREEPLVVATDAHWRTTTGPIVAADNYMGETYDARQELPGWAAPGYDATGWQPVISLMNSFAVRTELEAAVAPPARRIMEIRPLSVTPRGVGVFQFDLGQNMVGWARLRVTAEAGTEVTLRFAEMLNEDGTLHTENLRSARATDVYVCRGGGAPETFEPRFTFHGFRHVEVSGLQDAPSIDDLMGIVVHSDTPPAGSFECSNALVNQLQRNIEWSQRGNFLDVPTDCPQRNERLGWTGDIQVFARTAACNMDVAAFLTKYLADLRDGQLVAGPERGQYPWVAPRVNAVGGGPAWADAGVVVPWVLYERYGDVRALADHYPSLLSWMDFLDRRVAGGAPSTWEGFGDWLSLDEVTLDVPGWDDRMGGTPRAYLWQAFHIHALDLLSRIARVLDREADAVHAAERAGDLRREFAGTWTRGGRLTIPTQTAAVLALHFQLLADQSDRRAAADDLIADIERRGHLTTGFVGTPYLLHVLQDLGRVDLAYQLLERVERPGWLYPVTQGATTIWERWDAWTAEDGFKRHGMNSFNHYAYGAVGEWLFRTVAGIDTDSELVGYRRIVLAPHPGGSLNWARGNIDTIRGRVASEWRRESDGSMTLQVTIPPSTTALLRLPAEAPHHVTEQGIPLTEAEGVSQVRAEGGSVLCDIAAGAYSFRLAPGMTRPAPAG